MSSGSPPPASKSSTHNLNVVELTAGALSAVSAALAASFLGVTGTVTGAAVGSVVGTVGTAFYKGSLNRGRERLGTLRPRLLPATRLIGSPLTGHDCGRGADPAPTISATAAVPVPGAEPTTVLGAQAAATAAHAAATADGNVYGQRRRRRWPVLVAATVAAFVVSIAAIAVAEVALGHPLANLFGNHASGTTSVGSIFGGSSGGTPTSTPTPTVAPTGTSGGGAATTAGPTATSAPDTGSTPGTTGPPAGTGQATTAPTPPATTAPNGTSAP